MATLMFTIFFFNHFSFKSEVAQIGMPKVYKQTVEK